MKKTCLYLCGMLTVILIYVSCEKSNVILNSPVEKNGVNDLAKKSAPPSPPTITEFKINENMLIGKEPADVPLIDISMANPQHTISYTVQHNDGIQKVRAKLYFNAVANPADNDVSNGEDGILFEHEWNTNTGDPVVSSFTWGGVVTPENWSATYDQPFELFDQLACDSHEYPSSGVQPDRYQLYISVTSNGNKSATTSEWCDVWIKAKTPNATTPPFETFHVTAMEMEFVPGRARSIIPVVHIWVAFDNPYGLGLPAYDPAGIQVFGYWSGFDDGSCCTYNIAYTDADGKATIEGRSFKSNLQGDATFTVYTLDNKFCAYNPWENYPSEPWPGTKPSITKYYPE